MGIFFETLYRPLANLLVWLMEGVGTSEIILGILLLVLVIKLLLLPVAIKNKRAQIKMRPLAEKMKKIKEEVKDKQKQTEMVIKLYREEKINPFTPLLFLIIQIPIFLGIFFVLKDVGEGKEVFSEALYGATTAPAFDFLFLFFDLSLQGGILLALLIGGSQFVLMHEAQKNMSTTMSKGQKLFFVVAFPFLVAGASFFFAGTVGVYWFLNNCISILQEILILHRVEKATA